ncbi:hypothetical protein A2U01_0031391, partial [Trifolium medium]|nr:hypothetical protein [Trifolium medium]
GLLYGCVFAESVVGKAAPRPLLVAVHILRQ